MDGKNDPGNQAETKCAGGALVENENSVKIGLGTDVPYPIQKGGMLDEIVLFKRALEQKEIEEVTKGVSAAVDAKGCLAILWGQLKQE